jgi:hypothetical protein
MAFRDVDIAALLAKADTSAHSAGGLSRLVGRCWPAASDATQPSARDWVRRWGPARGAAPLPECGCRAGACIVCN